MQTDCSIQAADYFGDLGMVQRLSVIVGPRLLVMTAADALTAEQEAALEVRSPVEILIADAVTQHV